MVFRCSSSPFSFGQGVSLRHESKRSSFERAAQPPHQGERTHDPAAHEPIRGSVPKCFIARSTRTSCLPRGSRVPHGSPTGPPRVHGLGRTVFGSRTGGAKRPSRDRIGAVRSRPADGTWNGAHTSMWRGEHLDLGGAQKVVHAVQWSST